MAASLPRSIVVLILIFQVSSPPCAFSQQPSTSSSGVLNLTLKEAVQLALKQNPQRIIAHCWFPKVIAIARSHAQPFFRKRVTAARERLVSTTYLAWKPILPKKSAGPFQYIEAGPAFSQTLLNLPLIRGYQIGQEGRREARADEQTTREIVVNAVVDQYLQVLRAIATRDAAASRVALAQRLYDQATELQKTGIGLNIDTVRANVELQNERQNLIDAEALTHTTRYFLAELLDLPRDRQLEVTDRLDFYDLPTMDRESLLNQALAQRPGSAFLEFADAHR